MNDKEYIAISTAMRSMKNRLYPLIMASDDEAEKARFAFAQCVEDLATLMANDDPMFNRVRFFTMCGL